MHGAIKFVAMGCHSGTPGSYWYMYKQYCLCSRVQTNVQRAHGQTSTASRHTPSHYHAIMLEQYGQTHLLPHEERKTRAWCYQISALQLSAPLQCLPPFTTSLTCCEQWMHQEWRSQYHQAKGQQRPTPRDKWAISQSQVEHTGLSASKIWLVHYRRRSHSNHIREREVGGSPTAWVQRSLLRSFRARLTICVVGFSTANV